MKERSYEQQRCVLVTMSCNAALSLEKMEGHAPAQKQQTLSRGSHTRNGHPFRSGAWLIPSTAVSIDPSFPRSAFS